MKNFGIVINETKDPKMEVTNRIRAYLENRGAACVVLKDARDLNENVECMIQGDLSGNELKQMIDSIYEE